MNHSNSSINWGDLQGVDVSTVDKESLVDLRDIQIDESLPIPERVADFVEKIRNPYCFRIDGVVVKVSYKKDGPSFQQNFEDMLASM